ncbi:MAG: fumarate hydratase [Spirochaetes bacterium]|nr:fumarate hydratase [Spirochaetota bacterium]
MREILIDIIISSVRNLCIDANYNLNADLLNAYKRSIDQEGSEGAKGVLNELIENALIAKEDQIPLCQDCGLAVIFMDIGQDVHITGGDLREAVNEGVRQGYKDGYLRKSSCHPFTRENTNDNTPAIIHFNIVPGDKISIKLAAKGGGSENMSRIAMLVPAEGIKGVKKFVVNTVRDAGANPCPPTIIGVGIGGTFEHSAILSKKALMREIGVRNPDQALAEIEVEILKEINHLGIGPMGYGGAVTSLDVFIETVPCHIASLPVAVNINCHSARHKEIII